MSDEREKLYEITAEIKKRYKTFLLEQQATSLMKGRKI